MEPSSKYTHIDLALLESNALGSREFIIKVIDLYLQQLPALTEDLRAALDTQNWQQVAFLAHKLKSSAEMFGSVALAKALRTLEANAKAQVNLQDCADLMTEVESLKRKVVEEMVAERRHYMS
jgi:HPt (histidine-containing phosphotransfer) domain-containing protein